MESTSSAFSPTVEGVVLLHGIFRTSRSMAALARDLEQAGYTTLNVNYPSTRLNLAELVEWLHPLVQRFALGVSRLHFVGYSMGGLLIRAYLARYRPAHLGRVVMIGTPNRGSEVADFLKPLALYRWLYGPAGQELGTGMKVDYLPFSVDYPLGIIAGNRSVDPLCGRLLPRPHDGKVSVENTKLEGMTDHKVLPVAHPFLPGAASVRQQVLAFLRRGLFEASAAKDNE